MTSWLPLLSSLIVATAALIGVLINNRTNRDAITAADERNRTTLDAAQRNIETTNAAAQRNIESANAAAERREQDKWRRDQILTAISSVLQAAADVRQALWDTLDWKAESVEEVDRFGKQVQESISACNSFITKLRVLSNPKISNRCEDLLRTLTAAQSITVQRLNVELDVEATMDDVNAIRALWHKAIANTVQDERAVIDATRAELGIEALSEFAELEPEPSPSPA
ncbi:hypothetical protein OG874_09025 [Nocardia sp. NBC_00565]|uniref:hypothetical protein n=1 Tax=Nocardia sp. NBC_00565 TaxID=2975993 RepID=UPI002E81782E|nr:hypothetical protein [Nocardia sp. NBC_00565]WUC05267.1 hypothetical protein OG874_09025 [Nocardia sp. NBC_00565]